MSFVVVILKALSRKKCLNSRPGSRLKVLRGLRVEFSLCRAFGSNINLYLNFINFRNNVCFLLYEKSRPSLKVLLRSNYRYSFFFFIFDNL